MANLKFKKVANLPAVSASKEGDVFFCKSDETIYVRGANGYEKFRGEVDTSLSSSSNNPLANKVIKTELDKKSNTGHSHYSSNISFDNSHPAKSDLISLALPSTVTGVDRLAFLPADQIVIEQSTDNGETWSAYPITDANKEIFFSSKDMSSVRLNIPLKDGKKSIDCKLRITITAMKFNVPDGTPECEKPNYWKSDYVIDGERYLGDVGVLDVFVSTAGGGPIQMQYETRAGNGDWVIKNTYNKLIGWPGRNLLQNNGLFGGTTTQLSNDWCWRFTFNIPDIGTSNLTSIAAIFSIKYYSYTQWNYSNNMMRTGHLYNWDGSQNATFPSAVTATKFNGPATKVVDYGASDNSSIQIGYRGAGLTADKINQVACYTENGTKIKDANANVLKEWLNLKVDSELSNTSTNPVQNKVIKSHLDNLENNINTVSATATAAYQKPSTGIPIGDLSSSVSASIASVADKANDNAVVHITGDETISGHKIFDTSVVAANGIYVANIDSDPDSRGVNVLYETGGKLSFTSETGSTLLTNLADPQNDQDAATKKYVDTHSGGSDVASKLEVHNYNNSDPIVNVTNYDDNDLLVIKAGRGDTYFGLDMVLTKYNGGGGSYNYYENNICGKGLILRRVTNEGIETDSTSINPWGVSINGKHVLTEDKLSTATKVLSSNTTETFPITFNPNTGTVILTNTSGTKTVSLPSEPSDGRTVTILRIGSTPFTLTTGDGKAMQKVTGTSTATTMTLNSNGKYTCIYSSTTKRWYIMRDDFVSL